MKKYFLLVFAAVLFLALVSAASAQKPIRIKFNPGATSSVVSGSLSGYKDQRSYAIRVRKGQTLSTEALAGSGAITIWIKTPSGETYDDDMDMSCHSRREVKQTLAGDYILMVKECEKADRWRGRFKFRVRVR